MNFKILPGFLALFFLCVTTYAQQAKKTIPAKKTTVTKNKPVIKKTVAIKKDTTIKISKPVQKEPVTIIKPTVKTRPSMQPDNKNITIADLNMSDNEKKMVDEINMLRSNPKAYVKYINAYLKTIPSPDKSFKKAASELISELNSLEPLGTLNISPALYIDARQFGKEMIQNNVIEHSTLPYAENLIFEHENVRDAVIDLLIDDGVENRGHRKNLLNNRKTLVAVFQIPGKVDGFSFGYIQEFK